MKKTHSFKRKELLRSLSNVTYTYSLSILRIMVDILQLEFSFAISLNLANLFVFLLQVCNRPADVDQH